MKESQNDIQFTRNKAPKKAVMEELINNPLLVIRELNNRNFYNFLKFFWPEISNDTFKTNWHIPYLCSELQEIAERVGRRESRKHDLLINIPPGTTKTITCSIMFPIWCWTRWHWMRFITASYSASLALESAEYSRDIMRSEKFKAVYPELEIKDDKDTKSNFKVVKRVLASFPGRQSRILHGGNRYSTSIGGTVTGYHGHINIWDDPINPHKAVSEVELNNANRWVDTTLSMRKTDKEVTTTIGIMQRLHQNDPSGHLLKKKKTNIKHISLPGEIRNYKEQVQPQELMQHYKDDLFDPVRMNWKVLKDMEADLGQYGYAGQIGQKPTPPGGGMFQVDNFHIVDTMPHASNILEMARYWDKAGTREKADGKAGGAYTVGVKICKLRGGRWLVIDVKRGRWESNEREKIIRKTAEADGGDVKVYIEQEPGSGGKESAQNTIKNLAGFSVYKDIPQGDKIYRADPYSVQVNDGNVLLLRASWNYEFIEEHRYFPFSTYKDQVDAAGGGFAKLNSRRKVEVF